MSIRALFGAAVAVLLASLGPLTSGAGAQTELTIMGPSSSTGTVGVHFGVTFTAEGGTAPYSWSLFGTEPPGLGFSSSGDSSSISGTPNAAGHFDVTVQVTASAARVDGADQVGGGGTSASLPISITIAAAPPPPTTTTTTTIPRTTTTTTPRTTSTTRPAPTTTSAASATSTASTTTTTTTVPPTTSPPTSTPPTSTPRSLVLSQPAVEPGGQLAAHGNGCTPGSDVRLTIGSATVGTTIADQRGGFSAPVVIPDLALGRYDVVAQCGPTLMTTIDLAVATSVDTATGTLGLFFFFFLLSLMLFRRRRLVRPGKHRAENGAAPNGVG